MRVSAAKLGKLLVRVPGRSGHCTVSRWHVGEGDMVKQGQTLVDLDCRVIDVRIQSPYDGRVDSINAAVNQAVAVDFGICTITVPFFTFLRAGWDKVWKPDF
eukprot:Platyproteum_vivax@DN2482_c0_g1_i2.p1